MFDRMRIPASRENLAPPLLVGDFLIVDIPVEDTRERTHDVPDGVDASNNGICGSCGPLGAGEQAHSYPRDVFGRDQRQNGALIAERQSDRTARRQACANKTRHILVEDGSPEMQRADAGPLEYLF